MNGFHYLGTTNGWTGWDVSQERCAGEVRGSGRIMVRPLPDKYSLGVMRRIIRGRRPKRTIADVLNWPKKEVA